MQWPHLAHAAFLQPAPRVRLDTVCPAEQRTKMETQRACTVGRTCPAPRAWSPGLPETKLLLQFCFRSCQGEAGWLQLHCHSYMAVKPQSVGSKSGPVNDSRASPREEAAGSLPSTSWLSSPHYPCHIPLSYRNHQSFLTRFLMSKLSRSLLPTSE